MKKIFLILMIFLLLTGCSEEHEEEKNNYLSYKNNLQTSKIYTNQEDLPCDVTISIDRINNEEISFRAIMDNPKENMYNVKAILIHNHFTEDIFPSIGIFDESEDLIKDNEEVKGIELVGYIETTKSIENLNLEIKLFIEYTDINGDTKTIYYKDNNEEKNEDNSINIE